MTSHALGRAHPRYALDLDAEIRFGDLRIPARSRNVSSGGMCFTLDEPLPVGCEVELSMALVFEEEVFSEPLNVRARVVWCTRLGDKLQVGTCFVGLTNEDRDYLEMFLRYLKEGEQSGADEESNRST